MPFIVATYVYASSQGQRTHSAQTKIVEDDRNGVKPIYRRKEWKENTKWNVCVTEFVCDGRGVK
jgi:hypothetical protein